MGKLTAENYYKEKDIYSSSQIKTFLDCQARGLAEYLGEWETEENDAMLAGSYLDSIVEGTVEQWEAEHWKVIGNRGKAGRENLKAPFQQVWKMWERVQEDSFFMDYLQGEKQVILEANLFGYPFKGRLDILAKDRIVDLKTTGMIKKQWNDNLKRYETFAEYWRYDIQGAIYQALVKEMTGKKLPFYLAVVTREKVTDYEILKISDYDLELALDQVEQEIDEIGRVKAGLEEPWACGVCDYCKTKKRLSGVKDWREID